MKQKEVMAGSEVQEGNIYKFCLRCGRRLKTLENQQRGMGKTCWEKAKTEKVPYTKLF